MAEPFSIAAGILTVIDLTAKVISKCKHLIETTRDAPNDLRHIFIEVSSLKATLESLQYLSAADSDFSDAIRDLNDVDGAVKGCNSTVKELAAELDGLAISKNTQTTPGKRQMLKGSLKWCLKESRARKLLDEAIQYKSTISLALLGEVARDIKELRGNVGKMREDLSESKQHELCRWLERNNPTLDHNNAQKLHEEQTSQWINRLGQYKKWLTGSYRFIWIHGIPGAGKTVLLSYIIEQTKAFCAKFQGSHACLYYYCSYRHTEDQTLAFLRWIVSQLCRDLKSIPQEVWDLYQKNTEPTLPQLKWALELLLKNISVLYILLDAVDECNTRGDLLQLLTELATDPAFTKVRILATSRQYPDIEHVLKPISEPLSMCNPLVDEDIRAYVDSELRTNHKFRRWPDSLVDKILIALVAGAKGMFRWAACQLHILQRKRCESDLRKALTELPETLDETYERILLDIPMDEWLYVRTTLLWICAHESLPFTMGIPANCLVSAVFSHDRTGATTEYHAYDYTTLQEICGCLIRTSTFEFEYDSKTQPISRLTDNFLDVSLAHYTVKEFLYSDRISKSNVSYFSTSEKTTAHEFLGTVFKFCSQLNLETPPGYFFKNFQDYCREIGRVALGFWKDIVMEDEELWDLQIRFLDSPQYESPDEIFDEVYIDDSNLICPHFNWDSASYPLATRQSLILMRLLDHWDFEMCAKFLDGQDFEPIFHSTLSLSVSDNGFGKFQGTMLEAIHMVSCDNLIWATYNILLRLCRQRLDATTFFTSYLVLHYHKLACFELRECFINQLLKDGIDPNSPELVITFLQIAVLLWDYHGTKLLLEKGAKPNGIGNPNGKKTPHIDISWGGSSPLHIIKNAEFALKYHERFRHPAEIPTDDRPKIRRLLIEYGAKDFVLNKSGKHVYEGRESSILRGDTDFEDDESQDSASEFVER